MFCWKIYVSFHIRNHAKCIDTYLENFNWKCALKQKIFRAFEISLVFFSRISRCSIEKEKKNVFIFLTIILVTRFLFEKHTHTHTVTKSLKELYLSFDPVEELVRVCLSIYLSPSVSFWSVFFVCVPSLFFLFSFWSWIDFIKKIRETNILSSKRVLLLKPSCNAKQTSQACICMIIWLTDSHFYFCPDFHRGRPWWFLQRLQPARQLQCAGVWEKEK